MQNNNLSETVPAALRAELARRGIAKGLFAQKIGHDEAWLYRRLTCRAALTLDDLDLMCAELELSPAQLFIAHDLLNATPARTKKTTAGRSTGRRSRTQPPGQE